MAATAEKGTAAVKEWSPEEEVYIRICCDQFNVNNIIYKKIQLEDAIIDGGIIVEFQLLPSSLELESVTSCRRMSSPPQPPLSL
jgi:hypothetical protein